jgi:chromosome segregation ATPase
MFVRLLLKISIFANLRNRAKRARRKENRFAKRIQKVAEAVSERAEDRAVIRSLMSVNKQLVTANKEQAKAHEAGLTRVLDQSDAHSAEVTRLRTELASLEESYRNSASSSSEEDKVKEKLISDLRSQLAEVTKRQLSLHVEVFSPKKIVTSVLPAASAAEHQGLKKSSFIFQSNQKLDTRPKSIYSR